MSPSLPDDSILLLNNDDSWWAAGGAAGLDQGTFSSPLAFDASESGLFNGNFVPPPPRPPFLDESAQSDGLTTCGMCSWATKSDQMLATNSTMDSSGEWGFTAVMVVVSVISALIGAFIMVTFLKCRRLKATNSATRSAVPWWWVGGGGHGGNRPVHDVGHQRTNTATKHGADTIRVPHASSSNSGVWTWLGQRRSSSGPDPLSQPSSSPAENHYTHMDDSYNPELGEALYAELDRESGNPSYQNTAYSACGEADKELQVFSSAPSSAYYSDLSVTTTGERTYEIVGLASMNQNCCPLLEGESSHAEDSSTTQFDLNVLSSAPPGSSSSLSGHHHHHRRHNRLSAINEGGTNHQLQPSDFV